MSESSSVVGWRLPMITEKALDISREASLMSTSHKSPLPPFAAPTAQRSKNMAAIKSRDTKPEIFVRRALHEKGFRFRLHRRDLPGNPDIVLPRYRTVVLVHGCFWHGHGCPTKHVPKSNSSYWTAKIARNMERDERNAAALAAGGWRTVTIWECSLADDTRRLINSLIKIRSSETQDTDTH